MKRYFLKLVKKILKLYKKQKNSSDEYYYSIIINEYSNIKSYLALYNKCINTDTINLKTDVNIHYSEFLKFGASIKDAKKLLKKPNYHIQNNKSLNIEILVYRILIGTHRVKCQMHFFRDQLFLYNYTFTNTKKEENTKILEILHNKYLDQHNNQDIKNIIDNYNNCIQINNDLELTINYIALNSELFKKIKGFSISEEELKNQKNNFIYEKIYTKL
jgi:hypothetical protein